MRLVNKMSERKSRLASKSNTLTPTTPRCDSSYQVSSALRGTVASLSGYIRKNSPNRIKKLPLSDKEWQKSTLGKVRNHLHGIDPKIRLTPLSTATFIYATNLLLTSKLGESIELTKDNYKEELPVLLNILEYPTALSASTLKHPNLPHSFPAILGMWLFILDLDVGDNVDINQHLDKIPERRVYLDICIKSLTDSNLPIESVTNDLNEIYGINKDHISIIMKEVQRLKKENEMKKKQIEELHEMMVRIKDEDQRVSDKLAEVESITSCYNEVFLSYKQTENVLNEDLKNLNDIHSQLKVKLEENGLDHLSDLKNEVKLKVNTLRLLKEKHNLNMNKISKLDKDIVNIKGDVEFSIFNTNNYIQDLGLDSEVVEELMAPTTGFAKPDIVDEFKSILGKWTKIMQQSETARIELSKLDVENNQMDLKLAMRRSYLRLLADKECKIQEKSKLKFEVVSEKILAAVNQYEGIRKSTEEISLYKENVAKLKLKYKELVKKNELFVEECQEHYNEYCIMIFDNIKEMNNVVKGYTKSMQADIDKALNEFQLLTEDCRATIDELNSAIEDFK